MDLYVLYKLSYYKDHRWNNFVIALNSKLNMDKIRENMKFIGYFSCLSELASGLDNVKYDLKIDTVEDSKKLLEIGKNK